MKTRQIFSVGIIALVIGLVPPQAGCKALTPEVKQDVLQKKDVACALENAFLSDERITVICGLADQFLRPILDLVSAQRVALAKSHAVGVTEGAGRSGGCGPAPNVATDGGTPDAAVATTLPALKDAGSTTTTDGAVRPVAPKAR